MATTKRHIAVYLDPAVQQALSEFCEQRGLKSRKGVVFSAGVNTALAEFFGISEPGEGSTPIESSNIPAEHSSIPSTISNIPSKASSIPSKSTSNTPENGSSIPLETLAIELLPGKLQA